MAGHFKAQGVEPMRYLREVRVEDASEHKTGDVVTVADFSEVTAVDVTGTSRVRVSRVPLSAGTSLAVQ